MIFEDVCYLSLMIFLSKQEYSQDCFELILNEIRVTSFRLMISCWYWMMQEDYCL